MARRPALVRDDPGASLVRTRLAWRRTALTAAAVMLLALRPAFADPSPARVLGAAGAMTAWAVLVEHAYRRLRTLDTDRPQAGHPAVWGCAGVVLAFGLAGGLVVIL